MFIPLEESPARTLLAPRDPGDLAVQGNCSPTRSTGAAPRDPGDPAVLDVEALSTAEGLVSAVVAGQDATYFRNAA